MVRSESISYQGLVHAGSQGQTADALDRPGWRWLEGHPGSMPSPGTVGRLTPSHPALGISGQEALPAETSHLGWELGASSEAGGGMEETGKGEDPHLPGCGLPPPPVKALQES